MFAEDLSAFLKDFGVPVSIEGAEPVMALLDQPDLDEFGGRAQATDYRLEGEASIFGGLRPETRLTVLGGRCAGTFTVRNLPTKLDDGAFVLVPLSRIAL